MKLKGLTIAAATAFPFSFRDVNTSTASGLPTIAPMRYVVWLVAAVVRERGVAHAARTA